MYFPVRNAHHVIAHTTLGVLLCFTCYTAYSEETVSVKAKARSLPTIDWNTTISHFQFDAEKFLGQRLTVHCPPQPRTLNTKKLHGTDTYPSESAICMAALHAGKIDAQGGIVTIELIPGGADYQGSQRNGVESVDLPPTKRSIVFVDEQVPLKVDARRLALLPQIDWDTKFTATGLAFRDLIGQRFTFRCPPAPQGLHEKIVFGTDTYEFNSVLGLAAVHAGKLTRSGGVITVQLGAGQSELVGSIRHGVETRSKGKVDRSLSFVESQTE